MYLFLMLEFKTLIIIEDVSMMKEFLNILPKELVSLSSLREVEFCIEVVSSTSPITKTPYKMRPKKL